MHQRTRPNVGMEVIDNADHMVGTVESVEHDHFVVEKGFFFPQSHTISNTAIDSIDGNEITLRISRDEAMNSSPDSDWADKPHHGENVPDTSETEISARRGGVDPHKF